MTLKAQVANGLKWQVITIMGRQVVSLVVFTVLARLLDPTSFGLIALVGVYFGFVTMFTDQGIGHALIQRQNLEPEHLDTAFWFNVGCAAILCIATALLAGPMATLYREPRLTRLLQWSSIGLVIRAISAIQSTLFLKAMDFRRPAIRTLISILAGGIVGISMAFAGCGVWALIGQQLGTAFAGTIFLWSVSSYRPSARFSLRHLRELFSVSSSVFATSLLWFLASRLDQLVIGRLAGVPSLGLYVVASKFPDLAKTIANQPIAEVSLPALSRLQDDREKMKQTIYRGMELTAIVAFAAYVGLAAVASDVLPLVIGAKWAAAAGLCSLLSIYALIVTLQVFFFPTLLASGGVGRFVILNMWQTIGVLVACLVGIQFGVAYLVVGMIVNNLVISIPALLFLRQRIGLSPANYCKPCLVPLLASVSMLATIWVTTFLLPRDILPLLRLVCNSCLGGIAYFICVAIFARPALKELVNTAGYAFRQSPIFGDAFDAVKL